MTQNKDELTKNMSFYHKSGDKCHEVVVYSSYLTGIKGALYPFEGDSEATGKVLIGCFEHNMDSKGRIIIPAKWRLDLGARIIVTCGFARKGDYQCLMGMSEERWNAFVNAVQNVSLADIVVQKALRKLFALACECELDKQGRILIAPSLRERAQLDGDIMLAGANNRIEIWNRAKWNEEMDDESGFDDETLLALTRIQSGL